MGKILSIYALTISISLGNFVFGLEYNDDKTESIADYWFRINLLLEDPQTKSLTINEKAYAQNREELNFLWKLVSTRASSPIKTHILYRDSYKSSIDSSMYDESKNDEDYGQFSGMREYINAAIPEIDFMLKHGYQPKTLSFEEVQQKPFVKKLTLAQETIRLCGIDQEVEHLISSHLFEFVNQCGFSILHAYYFGSRVMPRSEVIKRDQKMRDSLPINDDGVMKNAVRIKGMTHISDLEIMVLVLSDKDAQDQELKQIASQFKKDFAHVFRDFTVSVKFIPVPDPGVLGDDPFNYINQVFTISRNKPMSRFQFVKI